MAGGEQQRFVSSPASGGGKLSQRRHWIRKKIETLSGNFNPIPVKPPVADVGAHRNLLVSLGLWEFVNLRFDAHLRADLLTEFVASYKYDPRRYRGVGYVHGVAVTVTRAAVANALHLPAERERFRGKANGRRFPVSEEEGLFVEELFWGFFVLKDDDYKDDYVLGFADILKERKYERADWAGFIWRMMERELSKGQHLVNCHYSSHLQVLLKHQRPQLFENEQGVEVAGSTVGKRKRELSEKDEDVVGDEDEFILKISEEEDEDMFLEKKIDQLFGEEMDGSGTELRSTQCNREDDAMATWVNQARERKVGDSLGETLQKVQIDLCSEKENDVITNEASEAVGKAITGNPLGVHCVKEADAADDKGSELVCEANFGDVVKSEVKLARDQHQPELGFGLEDATEKNGDSLLADFAGGEVDWQDVASVDLFAQEGDDTKEGTIDGLVCQETENQSVDVGSCQNNIGKECILVKSEEDGPLFLQKKVDALATLVDQTREGKNGDLLGDKEQALHRVQIDLCSEKEDDVIPIEANGAEFGNPLDVRCAKEADAIEDKEFEPMCEANFGDSIKAEVKLAQDQHQHELGLENATEVDCQDVAYVDLLAQEVRDKKEGVGSCQDRCGKEFSLEVSEEEDDAMATLVNQAREGQVGDLLGEMLQKVQIDLCSEKEDDVITNESIEAVGKTITGNPLGVHCVKEADATDDKGSELVCEANFSDAVKLEVKLAQDQQKKGDSLLADFVSQDVASIDLFAQEVDDKKEGSADGLVFQEIANQSVDVGSCKNDSGKVFIEISEEEDDHLFLQKKVDELYDEEMDRSGTELRLSQSNKEDQTPEGKNGDLLGDGEQALHKVQIGLCSDKSDEECQNAFEDLEITSDAHVEELMDLDLCTQQVKLWTARLTNSARRKVEEYHNSNAALQKKIEEQNQLIQQYELMLQKERQEKQQCEVLLQNERRQKQTGDLRYERELHLMHSVLQDYKKIIKKGETSFAKYRERAQLPEEPLYMPHPDGGGNVILVSEWKQLEEERQKKRLSDIKAMVEDFTAEWKSRVEEQLCNLDVYCNRLGEVEHDVRTLSGRL